MNQVIQHSETFLRQRKFLLFAPLLLIAFLSLGFYGLGGGKANKNSNKTDVQGNGLNTTLPGAHFDKSNQPSDKLGFYNKAALDSERIRENMRKDPYYKERMAMTALKKDSLNNSMGHLGQPGHVNIYPTPLSTNDADKQANKVLERLEQLKQQVNQAAAGGKTPGSSGSSSGGMYPGGVPGIPGSPGSPLYPGYPGGQALPGGGQSLPGARNTVPPASDAEMDKWNAVLDKILRLKYPNEATGRDTGNLPGTANVLQVSGAGNEPVVKSLTDGKDINPEDSEDNGSAGGFMELGDTGDEDTTSANTIRAVINRDETLTAGAIVELRLSEEAVIGNMHIPKGNLLYGKASISGERLNIDVSSLRLGNSVYPVALSVYDLDGLQGVWVPGAISRDVSKESADQAISGMGLMSMDPSVGAQAASAGIQAAKTLASRKITLVRVSVKAGYDVLLKNNKR